MRIATWNVNSLVARLERVLAWLDEARPDICCLQETKLADERFPHAAFADLGYEGVHAGTGRWSGVAIVSRLAMDEVVTALPGAPAGAADSRYVEARCGGSLRVASVYVPNGRSLDSEHYGFKLAWLDALEAHLRATAPVPGDRVICGDFNIAPEDRDVWDPAALAGETHVSGPEREALQRLEGLGYCDAFRELYQEQGLFTWWDYRAGSFHKHHGMRIDLVLLQASLVGRLRWALVDRNARKGRQPSDHAPVVVELAPAASLS